MEDLRSNDWEGRDREIAYNRTVKAGKRIYYLDVKRSHNDDLYLSLTESKKKVSGNPENPNISYEKHKIFLYEEDLSKFTEALIDVIKYMQDYHVSDKTDDSDNDSLTDALNSVVTADDSEPAIKLNLEDFE